MSGICGWIGHGGAEGDLTALLTSMAAPLEETPASPWRDPMPPVRSASRPPSWRR